MYYRDSRNYWEKKGRVRSSIELVSGVVTGVAALAIVGSFSLLEHVFCLLKRSE